MIGSCLSCLIHQLVMHAAKKYATEALIFGFKLPSAIIADKTKRFLIKYDFVNNLLFKLSRLPL